jgi:hypothetical protein
MTANQLGKMFPKFTIKIPAITVDFYPSISNFMQGI